MTTNTVGGTGQTPSSAQTGQPGQTGQTDNTTANAPAAKDQKEFKELLAKMEKGEVTVKDLSKEDLQDLFKYTFKQSVLATGRQIQETARDIERENIDKGF